MGKSNKYHEKLLVSGLPGNVTFRVTRQDQEVFPANPLDFTDVKLDLAIVGGIVQAGFDVAPLPDPQHHFKPADTAEDSLAKCVVAEHWSVKY